MDLIIRGKKIKDNVRCTEGSSPIVPLFPTTEFIILLSLLSPIPCNPYKQEVREVVAAHYFMYKNAYCHHFIHLVTWYKPTLFVHQTGQACAMNTIGLYGEHGKLVQPRNNDFPCQSIQNLDTSSVGSCSKFHEILYQVLPLHPASFPFGGEG